MSDIELANQQNLALSDDITPAQRQQIIKTRMAMAESRVIKAVFPSVTNHHNTLFGGEALAWMDETAFIAATRFCRKPIVTVSSDRIDFKKPIPAGTMAELIASVIHVGNTSLKVEVNIYIEAMDKDQREHAIRGVFTMVAIDSERKPTAVLTEDLFDLCPTCQF
ncbi:acyl-CoA thioesterase [Shewanella dokdonensis]|uniref:Acyl-CoA thioesterase n=2 Tax=Shewanella dokdonensis TaxID=712036 RepID=A0ABX8DH30_9GAMM|nr:acyl-CoA thioesterase [Shewanella dokdonensis]MCL1076039.1 acyl-CoA thioesterase [Shewanella dokdonensis]QVK23217.1 acyl-CoA thioesterase [Shewanella dokdonensis]